MHAVHTVRIWQNSEYEGALVSEIRTLMRTS
jgi:hypothetical protein